MSVPHIKERIDYAALNKLNLARVLFAGTDIPDLANYPKKPTKPF